MAHDTTLGRSPLFAGLDDSELDVIAGRMHERRFEPGEQLCEAGTQSDRIWVITGGLVRWTAGTTVGGGEIELRMRKGDVIGAQDAITGAERTATVVASTVTTTLELEADALIDLARQIPQVLINVINTQRERLFRASGRSAAVFSASARSTANQRGEEIGICAGPSLSGAIPWLVSTARTASPRPVKVLDRSLSFAGALTASDEAASENATVLIPGDLDPANLAVMLDEVDRVVALAGTAEEAFRLGQIAAEAEGRRLEVVLVSDQARNASRAWSPASTKLIIRECPRQDGFPLADPDLAWLARHLTRTKLGVALGAGGAKGYAHVGFLQTLEEAGYTVDYVGGSSIGGLRGHAACARLRCRRDQHPLPRSLQCGEHRQAVPLDACRHGRCGDADRPAEGGHQRRVLLAYGDPAGDNGRRPDRSHPRRATTGSAVGGAARSAVRGGVFPTQERDGHRLIDAIALVPVPTAAVIEDGADIVVSVNLLGHRDARALARRR